MFSAVSRAAEKSTGDPSLGEDSDEDDLLIGDLDHVELLDSSISLCLLTGVLDLLGGVWESSVLGVSTVGLFWVSGTGITVSIQRCINIIIDMKSRRLAWLIRLERDGKSKLPSSEIMVEFCPCWSGVWNLAGVVPAGVPWPTGPAPSAETSAAESSRSAESATPAESSSCAGSASAAESSTTAGSSTPAESWSSAESATSAESADPVTPAESSSTTGLGGDWMTVTVPFRHGRRQFHITSGNMGRPRLILVYTLTSSMMMLLGQGTTINRCPRWRGQGPMINRCPRVMMMMSGRRPDIHSLPQSTVGFGMVRRINLLRLKSRTVPTRTKVRSAPHSYDAWASEEP